MNGFTVTIGLKDCAIDSKEYAGLDELMELEGFKRKNRPLAGRIHPANLFTHPRICLTRRISGCIDQDASALKGICWAESRVSSSRMGYSRRAWRGSSKWRDPSKMKTRSIRPALWY